MQRDVYGSGRRVEWWTVHGIYIWIMKCVQDTHLHSILRGTGTLWLCLHSLIKLIKPIRGRHQSSTRVLLVITTRRLKWMLLLSFTVTLRWHKILPLFYLCHLFPSSFYIYLPAVATSLILNTCGVSVCFLSVEVKKKKKHDVPLGHNYPMPATITVVPLQSLPEGRGHRAHTASPHPPE